MGKKVKVLSIVIIIAVVVSIMFYYNSKENSNIVISRENLSEPVREAVYEQPKYIEDTVAKEPQDKKEPVGEGSQGDLANNTLAEKPKKDNQGKDSGSSSSSKGESSKPDKNTSTTEDTNKKPEVSEGYFSSTLEEEIFNATNKYRVANGKAPYKKNTMAVSYGRSKSEEMFNLKYFSHTSPVNGTIFDIAERNGWNYTMLGENIYTKTTTNTSSVTGEDILASWLKSTGHRNNILSSDFKELGIGVVVKDGKIYATQIFYRS